MITVVALHLGWIVWRIRYPGQPFDPVAWHDPIRVKQGVRLGMADRLVGSGTSRGETRKDVMKRISILSMLILVVPFAIDFALIVRLHAEAFFYITGPTLGAMLAALAYQHDRSALITGGAVGGLCQGIIAVLILKRGYIFPDTALITAPLFLGTLAVHPMAGLVFGTLLYLAFRWASPRNATSHQ
jgi:hypothetical protein